MQVVSIAALLLVAVFAMSEATGNAGQPESLEDLWSSWKTTHKKSYQTPEEEKRRFEIFKDNKKSVDEHNAKYQAGQTTYTKGLNQFSDLTNEEFKERHTAPRPVKTQPQ